MSRPYRPMPSEPVGEVRHGCAKGRRGSDGRPIKSSAPECRPSIRHARALFNQFVVAVFHCDHAAAGQVVSMSTTHGGQGDWAFLAQPHY